LSWVSAITTLARGGGGFDLFGNRLLGRDHGEAAESIRVFSACARLPPFPRQPAPPATESGIRSIPFPPPWRHAERNIANADITIGRSKQPKNQARLIAGKQGGFALTLTMIGRPSSQLLPLPAGSTTVASLSDGIHLQRLCPRADCKKTLKGN
jgi:hypothetical protein